MIFFFQSSVSSFQFPVSRTVRILAVIIGKLLIFIIKAYQIAISPLFGKCCRFYPSCSTYCIMALEKYGCMKGLWLGILRICKCHPFHPGGVDQVPEKRNAIEGEASL